MLRRRNRKITKPVSFALNPAAFPPMYAKPRPATCEPLERRVFLSITSSTLAGPLTVGFQKTYQEATNGTVDGSHTQTLVAAGTASFNGGSNLYEYDDVSAQGNLTQLFLGISNTLGVKEYGYILTNSAGTSTVTISPAYISIPPTVNAGTTYTAVYTGTSVTTGSSSDTNSGVFTYNIELASNSTQSINVPAGTFNCYEVNTSVAVTVDGVLESPTLETDYYSPSVGKVESINVTTTGTGDNITTTTITQVLTSTSTSILTASQLAFTIAPATEVVGLGSTTPFVVNVEDADGDIVSADTSDVTVSLTDPQGATLGGTTTVAASGGVASFGDLTVDQTGTFTLTATDGSLTTAASPSFLVVNATPNFATLFNGALTVTGTAGNDTISLATSGSTLTATLNGVSANFQVSSITSIDVEGAAGDDTITLGAGIIGASVQGGPGDDSIVGGPGDDTLGGGQGNDTILGDGGDDLIHGGAGDDSIGGGQGDDNLYGGLGNDTMTGGAGNDLLTGGAGNNLLHGGLGDDIFFAINGNADTLYGGAGNNIAHIDNGLDQIPNSDIQTILFT